MRQDVTQALIKIERDIADLQSEVKEHKEALQTARLLCSSDPTASYRAYLRGEADPIPEQVSIADLYRAVELIKQHLGVEVVTHPWRTALEKVPKVNPGNVVDAQTANKDQATKGETL